MFAFVFGGVLYGAVETAWRGYTHPTMLFVGGVCFAAIYAIDRKCGKLPIYMEALIGGGLITTAELLSGCLFNLWLRMDVWDYSGQPLNLLGQICALYSLYWAILSPAAFFLCRVLGEAVGDGHSASAAGSTSSEYSSSPPSSPSL